VGVDALSVERMARAVERSGVRFLAKSFTDGELAYCLEDPQRLAGRWAAKEAVIKCFDRTPICFRRGQIEVLSSEGGAPRLRLLGRDTAGASVEVSITHHSGMAVAVAMLEIPGPQVSLLSPPPGVHMPERPLEGHKGTFGSVVALAGSLGLTGAAYLCATSAARSGAGTVRLLVAETIYPILATKCTEVMATPVQEVSPGALDPSAYEDAIKGHLEVAACGIVGPGLGQADSTRQLIRRVLDGAACPLVVDADALNAIAADKSLLGHLGRDRVLTPHPGEMARLTGLSTAEVQRDRRGVAEKAAREWGAVVVLKGAHTIVAAPDGQVSEDPHEVPALGTGGTGDVLSGVIAGLLAQGLDPFRAAVSGVYVHAEAGRRISARLGTSGLLASDLFDEIPLVMNALRQVAPA
jgi:NAD(P)H-hydrate epimerase